MDADNVGAPVTKQQWDYIHKMGDALRQSFENVSAVFAPSCISHSVLTKKDWQNVRIDDISIAEALHCWEHRGNGRRTKRKQKNDNMVADQPKSLAKRGRKRSENSLDSGLVSNSKSGDVTGGDGANRKKRKRKHRKNRKGRKRKGRKYYSCD